MTEHRPSGLVNRRSALKSASVLAASFFVTGRSAACGLVLPPVRSITSGPKHHWFGYYDKLQFDQTNQRVLSNEVGFEHRTPVASDTIAVGYVDTANGDAWTQLGSSTAWGWQQGCMLQWRPGKADEVLWNDRQHGKYVCRIRNTSHGMERTLSRPIYTVSPDGRYGLTADFARIQRMRPGYGYVGIRGACYEDRAPEDSGVWRIDLETGESKLIFSLADAASIAHQGQSLQNHWNYFNHLLISPDSSRFIVLHRWRKSTEDGPNGEPTGRFDTRMFTANLDGTERYILDPSGHTSHFIWRGSDQVCAWTRPEGRPAAFYVFTDQTRQFQQVGAGVMTLNGHNTYVPGTDWEWILNDTYPDRKTRNQTPYLFHVPSGRRVDLGHFRLPEIYKGEWRCDTHPRCSNDGKTVCIDSPHTGEGRQLHLIDISEIIG